jgi:hypothetical protein
MTEHPHAEHRPPADKEPATLGAPPPGTTSFGNFYPLNDILAVVDDPTEGERAVQSLKSAGVADDEVDLLDGSWFAEALRGIDRHGGIAARLAKALPIDERLLMRRYLELAEKGHYVIVVHAEEPEQIERAKGVLYDQGAHEVRHFGRAYVTDL